MGRLLQLEIGILGIGILITFTAFVATLDWLNLKFPNRDVSFVLPILWFLPFLIFQPLTIWKGNQFSFNLRIVSCFVAGCIFLIATPIIASDIGGDQGFALLILAMLLLSVFNAIAEASVYGLTGMLPKQYSNAYVIGLGASGVIVSALRMLCLAFFPNDEDGLRKSTEVYYIISGILLLICIAVQFHVMKNPEVIKYTNGEPQPQVEISQQLLQIDNQTAINSDEKEVGFIELMKMMKEDVFLIWLVLLVTLGFYPGLSLATEDESIPYAWLSTIMVVIFNFGDLCGKVVPKLHICSRRTNWVVSILRFLFGVTFYMVAENCYPHWLFGALWFKILNMFLFSLSNGYCGTVIIIQSTENLPEKLRERGGYIIATSLMFGIFCGTLVALSFTNVGHIPQS